MYNPPNPKTYFAIVWKIVKQIPEGRVSTYGQIASMIPPPNGVDPEAYRRLAPRWVGTAMRATPNATIPWQRVINSQGMISLPAGSRAAEEQRRRLEMEGIVFDKRGRIDLQTYGWEGPDEEWLEAHHLLKPRLFNPPKPRQSTLF